MWSLLTYWVSATEDAVLVQSGTKALVCAATSVTVLPCEEEAKASHNGVVPLIRELITTVVKEAIIRNIEHAARCSGVSPKLFWHIVLHSCSLTRYFTIYDLHNKPYAGVYYPTCPYSLDYNGTVPPTSWSCPANRDSKLVEENLLPRASNVCWHGCRTWCSRLWTLTTSPSQEARSNSHSWSQPSL